MQHEDGLGGRQASVGADLVTPADIAAAQAVLRPHIIDTTFDRSRTLSDILGAELWLKFENLQFTGSFKERGALNRLNALGPEERQRGVITMSAGNHAQGVAYHARRLGIPATIVMPAVTPTVKVENTRTRCGGGARGREPGGGLRACAGAWCETAADVRPSL